MGHRFFFLCACGSDGLILPFSLRCKPHRLSQFLSPCTSYLSWRRKNSVSLYLRISIPLAPFIVTGGSSLYLLCIACVFPSPSPSLCGYVFFSSSLSGYRSIARGFFLERENVKQSLNCKLEWVWILIGNTVWVLGFAFFFFLFLFVDKRLGLFNKGLCFVFLFLGEWVGVWKSVFQTQRANF